MTGLLFMATIYLLAAVVIVPIAVRIGLGSVLGYLAAGILIGPVFGLTGSETQDVQHFAEFGVVLMLFLIGLEMEPRALWDMRGRLLGLGGMQVLLTLGSVAAIAMALGLGWQAAVMLGMILALSSTAIVLQTLNEKRLMQTAGGRASFSVLLTQDIAVVPMLAAVPLLAGAAMVGDGAESGGHGGGHGADEAANGAAGTLMSMVQTLPGWGVTLLTLGIVAGIVLVSHYLSRPAFRFIHSARLGEMSTAFSLLIVMSIAFLMTLVGLSPALGTFVAGVVLANSEFRHQVEADIAPFKGLLLGLFFITVGAGIDFGVLAGAPVMILSLTLGLIALKAAILLGVSQVFGLRGRNRWLFVLGLAQAGEFGFLLVSFAAQQQVLGTGLSQTVLLMISLSMLLTPLLFLGYEALARRMAEDRPQERPADTVDSKGRVIVAGIGRFGQVVNRLVRMSGIDTTVLDADIATIDLMRRFGIKGFFGDPTRPELLHAAGLDSAQVLVVAVDDRHAALKIVSHARHARPDLHIVARARDRVHVYELFRAGANDIVRETFDSSVRAGRYVLENAGFSEYEAAQLSQAFYRIDRHSLRDLAQVWKPGVPVHENPDYIARARQLDADLEVALLDLLDEGGRGDAPDLPEGPGLADKP